MKIFTLLINKHPFYTIFDYVLYNIRLCFFNAGSPSLPQLCRLVLFLFCLPNVSNYRMISCISYALLDIVISDTETYMNRCILLDLNIPIFIHNIYNNIL